MRVPYPESVLLLLLVGCAPMVPEGKADLGGTTVAIKTSNKLSCRVERPDLIAQLLAAPAGYASDDNGKVMDAPRPQPVADKGEAEETHRRPRHDVCYPGWKEWHGRRWKCRYER